MLPVRVGPVFESNPKIILVLSVPLVVDTCNHGTFTVAVHDLPGGTFKTTLSVPDPGPST
jgi:hypothetical protein